MNNYLREHWLALLATGISVCGLYLSYTAFEFSKATRDLQYQETLSAVPNLTLARNSNFSYFRAENGDTVATAIPVALSVTLINTSNVPVTVARGDYRHFSDTLDTDPRNVVWGKDVPERRGLLPIRLDISEIAIFRDTVVINLPWKLKPFAFANDSISWKLQPLYWWLYQMVVQSQERAYLDLDDALASITKAGEIANAYRGYLEIQLATARETRFTMHVFYLSSEYRVYRENTLVQPIRSHN